MNRLNVDVAILGSGFGGSLLGLILMRLGKRVALIDRTSHPRFAIGESSTPLADFVLSDLAKRYDLPDLLPLASFGTWRKKHAELRCGLKRGFSYFAHKPDQPFQTDGNNSNQLLVAASSNDVDSDTHWHRADVDEFVFSKARESGVACLENTAVRRIEGDGTRGWQLQLHTPSGELNVRTGFVVDATGTAGALLQHLGIDDDVRLLQTNSRAIYGHFESVRRFNEVLSAGNIDTAQHPYACDNAALHHVLDDGWMWNLRFEHGLVSAGFVVDLNRRPASEHSPGAEWQLWLERYPAIADQFSKAELCQQIGIRSTGRMQRLANRAGGSGWVALPNTVGFIDPLHSTGIAHTLSAVERIAAMFADVPQPTACDVRAYDLAVRSELLFVDELVGGCYAGLADFRFFKAWCMVYFASAHSCEMRRVGGEKLFENGFLGAGVPQLRILADELRMSLDGAIANGTDRAVEQFELQLANAIEPFNSVGLCDPAARNMYANTAPPRGLGSA